MTIAVMECPACRVEISGEFRQSFFQALSDEEQAFLGQYLLADFNIKALASETGMGYAAIRSRLDRLIANCRRLLEGEDAKKAILGQVEAGNLSAKEAAERIRGLGNGE